MSRRVLIVTYFFPPVGGVGVQRTLKYATYLPRWGWEPAIVAPGDPAFPLRDRSLMDTLPADLEVHRTASLEPGKMPVAMARRLGAGRAGKGAVASDIGTTNRGGFGSKVLRKMTVGWNRVWGAVLFPDPTVAWRPFGVRAGRRAHRDRPVDVIYSSAAPITTHLIADRLSRSTGLPWVADFRDPWVDNPFASSMVAPKRWLQRRMERSMVERADRVILAMDGLRDMFVARYPELAAKFVYIPNGYDRNDVAGLTPIAGEPGRFTILFAGSLYRPGELDAFLGGVEKLVTRRPDLRGRLRVQFVGRVSAGNRLLADAYTAAGRIGDVVSFEGFVPRPVALARMAGADALLQLMTAEPGTEMFVGGKLLEYLAFDRPILAVMPQGEGRRLVDSLPAGRSADVEAGSVADALEGLLDNPPAPGPTDPEGRYDRVNLARRLAGVLDEVVAEHEARKQKS
jgi:glycosyltransferase involved in cell wall biosynthesis